MDYAIVAQALMMLVPSAISAAAGWLAARYKAAKAGRDEEEARDGSVRRACVLYMGERLDRRCERYELCDSPTAEQTADLVEDWTVYHGCGGDGIRTARVQRLVGFDLESLEEKE